MLLRPAHVRQLLGAGVALAALVSTPLWTAAESQSADQGVRTDYERAASLRERVTGRAVDVIADNSWIDGTTKFWYRKSVTGGSSFVLVDATAGTKAPAFDHEQLATALSAATGTTYTAVTLPFSTLQFTDNQQTVEFTIGGGQANRWRCTLSSYACTRVTGPAAAGGGRGGARGGGAAGAGGAAAAAPQVRQSPDESSEAVIRNYNVWVRSLPDGDFRPLSTDGSEGNAYTLNSLRWSPDSKKIAVFKRRPGYNRQVHYIETSPSDQVQPKHSSIFYRKPGDEVDFDLPVIFNLESQAHHVGDQALFPNPYANSRLAWREDSRAVTFEYNQRGHQVYRVLEMDAVSGQTRTIIEETSRTFVEYSGKRTREDIADGREIIWASERDGWNHLYLYDGVARQVKH